MKKCIFIGTCQVVALADILKFVDGFIREYTIEHVIPVHAFPIEQMDEIIKNIDSVDLIISQPISQQYNNGKFSTKRLMENVKKTKIILIPFAYFDGYFPSIVYMKDNIGNKVEKYGISYHDSNIIKHLVEGIDFNKTMTDSYLSETHNVCYHLERIEKMLLSENYYGKESSERFVTESIKKLEMRELFPYDYGKPVDVKISDFIRDNFRNILLFHTMNHPTDILLVEISKRILSLLKISTEFSWVDRELLGGSKFVIYPSTIKNTKISFPSPVDVREFVKKYINLYFNDIKISTLMLNY